MVSCARFLFVSSHLLLPSRLGALFNQDMARVRGLAGEIGELLPYSNSTIITSTRSSHNSAMPSISGPRETQQRAPTYFPSDHRELMRKDEMDSIRIMITDRNPPTHPVRGVLRPTEHLSSPATTSLNPHPSPLGFFDAVSQPMELAASMTPFETQTASQSNTPTWELASAMPSTEVTRTDSQSQSSSPSRVWSPAATPTRTPFSSRRTVQLPKFEVVLAGSLIDAHALTDTLSEYLASVFLGTIGLESLQGVDLVLSSNHSDNWLIELSWTGIASFDPSDNASTEMVKSATVTALEDTLALQSCLDHKVLQLGTVTVVRVHILGTTSFEPSTSPSHMPSFRPSRGVLVTICTIQKTQTKCLANDCEWRNQFRKCRDFLKREEIEQHNRTVAPYASDKGSAMPPIDRVPPQDSVTQALIILAIFIGSIVVLAIVGYVGKVLVVGWNKDTPSEHEGKASLLAELYGNATLPVSASTPPLPTPLSRPSAGVQDEEGLQDVYVRSQD
ncbi:hypothetical protein MHU86_9764 [Fragilaria crotonensis]|nr:hypothetical protein MHU86_9764 [Fragilaria crotonensis]